MADPPLLRTKLYVPPTRPELVPRPRLLQRLDEGLRAGRKLTLISAPAGFGKTTLVSAWLRGAGQPFTWLSLDEGDNNPVRFLNYLAAALHQIDGEIGQTVQQLLEAPQPPPAETLLTELINDITARPSHFVLVLDDYHTITELAVHEAVGFLLARQPSQLHLVIASRQDPPLPLSRLRGRGQVTEIRQSDLRFTPEEATTFLNQSMGLGLQASRIAALDTHTEGWIAGLQMAALALQSRIADGGTERVPEFIDSFSGRHHFILDYLTDEVLERQPEPIYEFLLQTCILERMCGPLCDAVVRTSKPDPTRPFTDSQATLEHLERHNLFVVPLDDERQWYRYHRLFAELLHARLHETEPKQVPELHRRAAVWYDENALPAEAVHHAMAIPDFELAADVIQQAILKVLTWSSISTATFLGWLNALPEETVHVRPWLRLFASRVLYVSGQRESGERVLQELESSLRAEPTLPDAERILALAVTDRASYAAVRGDVQQAIRLSRQALTQLPRDDAATKIRVESIIGLSSLRAGDLKEAERAFSEAIAATQTVGMDFAAALFICNMAEVQFARGQLRQAAQACEQAIQLGTVDGTPIQSLGFAELELGKIFYEQNDLTAAELRLSSGLEGLVRGQITIGLETGYAMLAKTRLARGDAEGALEAMGKAEQVAQANDIPRLSILISAYQARIWLAQGKDALAGRWARDYAKLDETEYLREFEDLTLARVRLAQGEASEALALLDTLLSAAEVAGRMGTVIEAAALRAMALQALNRPAEALESLARALLLAEPQGYVRMFIDEGAPMAHLLRETAAHDIAQAYVSRLLATLEGTEKPADERELEKPRPSTLVEPLSDREIEVLGLLADGLSNAEIAQRLFISLPTVKSHTRNIYGKLDVHSRKEAVARARALGILPS